MIRYYLVLVLMAFLVTGVNAQVQINGSVDVAIKYGGDGSGYFINGIQQDYNHLHARLEEFNLAFFAPISEEWYIEARTRVKNDAEGKLAPPKLELASINYSPIGKNYFVSAGKVIMPFGFYSNRQFQLDRTFIDYPMAYSWSIFMSRERGWWKGTRGKYDTDENPVSETDYGVQTIFYGGYTTGLVYGLEFDRSTLTFALTNESPTGYDASTIDTFGGMVRFTHTPSAYLTFGLSASHGSFMHETSVNDTVMVNQDFSEYTQTALGADFQLGFTFFEIVGEATYSLWNTP
ncbi:MAG: hypothetical protein MI700_01310, partial [Balneolales bacterium]|nr:hypothetical protein [Balneolales bacterium]